MTKDRTSSDARADSDGASTLDLSGRHVGSSYILQRPIGQGATGTVWRGTDLASGEAVAIKLLHESLLRQPKLVTRFVQERTILLMLRHRNVVRVRDLFSVGETLGLVMDLVSGGSLRDHLREHRTVPAGEAARLGAQIAAALAEAHELGVIHRDLKPDNVLLQTEDGRLQTRLTDFGVARILNAPSMTTPNAVVGTPHYMSPEAFHSSTPSPATDIYALGVLLYELVSGRPPYDSDSIPDLMRRHMDGDPERRPGIPDALWNVIMSCMEQKPRLRPAAAELVADLSDIAKQATGVPALPAPAGRKIVASGEPSAPEKHPSIIPSSRPPKPRNESARRRWVRPGTTVTLVAGAMLASAVATSAWNFGRADGDPGIGGASPQIRDLPAITSSTHQHAPHAASPPASSPAKQHPGRTAVEIRATTTPPEVRPTRTAAARIVPRSPQPEAQPYGPWQCTQSIAIDFANKIPLGPKPCQMTGRDIRYQASLTAPGGATGSISISLLDVASGRTVAGPKTCSGLWFTGEASTESCGPAQASPARGHTYTVLMSYRYERDGQTIASTARGSAFTW